MGFVDVVIIGVVALAVALCVWRLVRSTGQGGCVGCSEAGSCKAVRGKDGSCPACQGMLAHAAQAANEARSSSVDPPAHEA